MATKIKKSKYPDKSPAQRLYDKAFRDFKNKFDEKVEDIEVRGMQKCLMLILYILRSKYHSSDEDLTQLSEDIKQHAQWIREGKLTYEMIKNELITVYDVEF